MDKALAITHKYGPGVDFRIRQGGIIEWNDSKYQPPSDEDIELWYSEYKESLIQVDINEKSRNYLNQTDWLVIRHRDQKELGIETSISDEEYTSILLERQSNRNLVSE